MENMMSLEEAVRRISEKEKEDTKFYCVTGIILV